MIRWEHLYRFIPIERVTKALPFIDSNHAQIHEGNGFKAPVLKEGLVAAGQFNLVIDSGDNYVHFQAAKITATGHAKVEILELTSSAEDGDEVTPQNRHRFDGGDSNVTARTDDGSLVVGETLDIDVIGSPGARGSASLGGATGDDSEIVLKKNTLYAIRVTNLEASATIDVAIRPFWYEEGAA